MANIPTAATATTPVTDLSLRDIHLPDPVSWWPLAPGWWIIAGAILLFVIVFFASRQYYRSKALHRDANAELEKIKQQFALNHNQIELVQALSILLRRCCISFYPRHETAGLTGDAWLKFLDSTSPPAISNITSFYKGAGEVLASAPYMSESTIFKTDCDVLIILCETWISAQPVKKKTSNQPKQAH